MADMTVLLHDHVAAGKAVQDAAVLDVGTGGHHHLAEVASQAGQRTHVAAGTNQDVSDEDGFGMNERGGMDDGDDTLDLVDAHRVNLRESRAT